MDRIGQPTDSITPFERQGCTLHVQHNCMLCKHLRLSWSTSAIAKIRSQCRHEYPSLWLECQ
eukprot:scaffold64_cov338-Pavlova_lutheri.AAC.28